MNDPQTTMKTWATRILLGFVLFTLGFGIGKEAGLRTRASSGTGSAGAGGGARAGDNKVIVYYLHATFRCVTCNTIERMAREIVEQDFADALAAGRIEWREADFQVEEDLARKYDVASSCVVVVCVRNGVETAFQRLDDVWTLADDPPGFRTYVTEAIRKYLE